jgi:hypothetical protein
LLIGSKKLNKIWEWLSYSELTEDDIEEAYQAAVKIKEEITKK